ncbi:Zona pellucida domain [Trinorchestia longiramus]|nr:Zona pellucida domain [Trinorchestia longiramus]
MNSLMSILLLVATAQMISSNYLGRLNEGRKNRQLFVTLPTSMHHRTSGTTSGGRRPVVFLSSSSLPTEPARLGKYVPVVGQTSTTIRDSPANEFQLSSTAGQYATTPLGVQMSERTSKSSAEPISNGTKLKSYSDNARKSLSNSLNMKIKKTWKNTSSSKEQAENKINLNVPTESSTSTFSSTYPILTSSVATVYPSEANTESEVTEERNETARSALIRVPSRDSQVIFLADDPEAAAKIPGLLTNLKDQKFSTSADFYRVSGSTQASTQFLDSRQMTVPESDFTFPDIQTTYDSTRSGLGRTVQMDEQPTQTMASAESRDEIPKDEVGRARFHSGFPYRSAYPQRKPYRSSSGSSEIRKGSLDFPASPFLRTRSDGELSRPIVNMTRVTHIEAECQDDYMRIHTQFNGSFTGLIYSAGYAYDRDCIYVNGSGRHIYDFHIQLNRCGTLGGNERGELDIRGRPTQKNMMWNTLTVQYNPLIEEEWDEHFKVTCEYGYDFWKTVTFPFLDVEVQTGNPVVFTLTPPECHMEIRYGYGTSGNRITGPVRVGDPLTLVIYMRSELDGFDIVVSDCFAHNGGHKRISLIDHYGLPSNSNSACNSPDTSPFLVQRQSLNSSGFQSCPVDEKLISHFEGTRSDDGHFETQVYAFMKTFRFTGSPALYIECDVRMCHGECPPQPCHWKRTNRDRRSISSVPTATAQSPRNISESLNLFQALHVLRDDQTLAGDPLQNQLEGSVCLKSGTFSAAAGGMTAIIGLLTVVCLVLCVRARRRKMMEQNPPPPKPAGVPSYKTDFIPPSKRRLE